MSEIAELLIYRDLKLAVVGRDLGSNWDLCYLCGPMTITTQDRGSLSHRAQQDVCAFGGATYPPRPDLYDSFELLAAAEREGHDFIIRIRRSSTSFGIFAPHGGDIEPGTSQIADSIAGRDYSSYVLEGYTSDERDPFRLHITSTRFDEPRALHLAGSCDVVVTVHGCLEVSEVVFIGGLNHTLRTAVWNTLSAAGFDAQRMHERYNGIHPENLCNRGRAGAGLQLEISKGIRDRILAEPAGELLELLSSSIRGGLRQYQNL